MRKPKHRRLSSLTKVRQQENYPAKTWIRQLSLEPKFYPECYNECLLRPVFIWKEIQGSAQYMGTERNYAPEGKVVSLVQLISMASLINSPASKLPLPLYFSCKWTGFPWGLVSPQRDPAQDRRACLRHTHTSYLPSVDRFHHFLTSSLLFAREEYSLSCLNLSSFISFLRLRWKDNLDRKEWFSWAIKVGFIFLSD